MTEPRPVRLLTWDTIDKRCLVLERMPGEKVCASIRWVPWDKVVIDGVPLGKNQEQVSRALRIIYQIQEEQDHAG